MDEIYNFQANEVKVYVKLWINMIDYPHKSFDNFMAKPTSIQMRAYGLT